MNRKVITNQTPHIQTSQNKTNARIKKEYRDYKEKYVWKKDHITKSIKPRLKIVKAETEKNKGIINKYHNEKHRGIKRTNLCRSKMSLS